MITIDLRQPHLYPSDMIPMRLVTNGSGPRRAMMWSSAAALSCGIAK